jgi:hypothetical protein
MEARIVPDALEIGISHEPVSIAHALFHRTLEMIEREIRTTRDRMQARDVIEGQRISRIARDCTAGPFLRTYVVSEELKIPGTQV